MIDVTNILMSQWFTLLSGNISVPVYTIEAPPTEQGNYVVLRPESDSEGRANNEFWNTTPVIISEVVTRFENRVNYETAAAINSEIGQALYSDPVTHNLPGESGIQIVKVQRQSAQYLMEEDDSYKYHRLITRNVHSVTQS